MPTCFWLPWKSDTWAFWWIKVRSSVLREWLVVPPYSLTGAWKVD